MNVDHTTLPLSVDAPGQGLLGFVTPFGGRMDSNSYEFQSSGMKAGGRLVCLEEGFSIISFHGQFGTDHRLIHDHVVPENEPLYFLQYWPDPAYRSARLSIDGFSFRSFPPRHPVVTIVKSKLRIEVFHEAGNELKGICLLMNRAWVLRHFGGDGSETAQRMLCALQYTNQRNLSLTEKTLADTLFDALKDESMVLEVKALAYNLISQFYHEATLADEDGSHVERLKELAEVEKELMNSLYRALPFLDDLARTHFMSTSTLKRRFKQVYGLTIQDYYLTRKMELARGLLAEDGTVCSVAARLGYKSTSHFITLFKKYHGFPPGQARKTEAEH